MGEVPQAGHRDGDHQIREVRLKLCSLREGTVAVETTEHPNCVSTGAEALHALL